MEMSEFVVKIFFTKVITISASFYTLFTSAIARVPFMLILNEYFRSYKQIIKFKHDINFHFLRES